MSLLGPATLIAVALRLATLDQVLARLGKKLGLTVKAVRLSDPLAGVDVDKANSLATGISIQDVPEGLVVALALRTVGYGRGLSAALGVASGLTVMQTIALSLLMFTGGSQFAFIGVIAGGGTGAAACGAAALLGIRNAVYGMQVGRMLKPIGMTKLDWQHCQQARGCLFRGLNLALEVGRLPLISRDPAVERRQRLCRRGPRAMSGQAAGL